MSIDYQTIVKEVEEAAKTLNDSFSLAAAPVKAVPLKTVRKAMNYMAWLHSELKKSRRALVENGLAHYDEEGKYVEDFEVGADSGDGSS